MDDLAPPHGRWSPRASSHRHPHRIGPLLTEGSQ
jgi:hypothetical protein